MEENDHMDGTAGDVPETAPAGEAVTPKAKRQPQQESWVEVVKTIVYALLIAVVIRTLLFQPFNIPSASMESTLLVGDYLFVSKAAYGYSRFSLPWGNLWPLPHGRIFASRPKRGDVVVFKLPSDDSTDFIKRIVGLPGDRIQMKYGVLYINGQPVPKVPVAPFIEKIGNFEHKVPRYRETLPNGVSYTVLDREPDGALDNTGIFVVPPNHYFMMGDNRDNSDDSREEVGYVPFENLVGKAEILFFSTNGSARFWEFWKWPFAIRYDRIGHFIH